MTEDEQQQEILKIATEKSPYEIAKEIYANKTDVLKVKILENALRLQAFGFSEPGPAL